MPGRMERIVQQEIQRLQNRQSNPLISCGIVIILIIFAANISYETYDDMDTKFTITDSQSRNCLVDFQQKNCDPLKLTEECEEIFECVQKENDAEVIEKAGSLFEYFTSEIEENMLLPTVSIVILMIYKLTQNVEQLRRESSLEFRIFIIII